MLFRQRLNAFLNEAASKLPRQLAVAMLFVVFVFLSLVALAGWRAWKAYHLTIEQTQVTTGNLARMLAHHAEDAMKLSDGILSNTVERVEADGTGWDSMNRLNKLFVQQVRDFPQFHGMFVFDAAGRYLASAQPILPVHLNIRDRDYFKFHQQNNSQKAHIGLPVRSKTTGDWMVTVSKRINRKDGGFAGVASATIHMDYFREFHNSIDVGEKGVIFVATHEGLILTRRPFKEELIGTRLKNSVIKPINFSSRHSGTFIARSPIDQTERVYAYKYLEYYPFVAVIGLSTDEVLAEWRSDMSTYAVTLLLVAAILALLGWRLLHEIRTSIASERDLLKAQSALKRMNQILQEYALQDGLTGIANRRHFDAALKSEFMRATRSLAPLSVMMIDVDHFKLFNDRYGHPAGDKCLRIIAKTISRKIGRAGDVVARYGGEEFTVLLPDTDSVSAEAAAQRVCDAVAKLNLPHKGSPLQTVTVSIGIASFLDMASRGKRNVASPGELLKQADMALYLAKRNGRNCVRTAHDDLTDVLNT